MEFMEIEGFSSIEEEEVLDIDSDSQYEKFDATIGHIEEIIMSDEFQDLQNNFFDKYSHEFDDTEENKFIYTDIHKEYIDVIESYLFTKLKEMIADFSMEEFLDELSAKEIDADNEIFEILFSFTNFPVFKEMMISHKKSKETPLGLFDDLVCITPIGRSPQVEERANPCQRSQGPCFDLGAMSLKGGSFDSSPLLAHESALKSKFGTRPSSSKGQRKVSTVSHHAKISANNKPVPSTSKNEDLNNAAKGTKVRSKNHNK